jgi:hypothetical protein
VVVFEIGKEYRNFEKSVFMEQLILDIHSESEAKLIKELLKKFKHVEIQSFSSTLSSKTVKERIQKGLDDADQGKVTEWKTVKAKLMKKIQIAENLQDLYQINKRKKEKRVPISEVKKKLLAKSEK